MFSPPFFLDFSWRKEAVGAMEIGLFLKTFRNKAKVMP